MEISLEERAGLITPNLELVRDFCQRSLQGRLRGGGAQQGPGNNDAENYAQVVAQLSVLSQPAQENDDTETLLEVLCALPSCISIISRSPPKFADLLNSIFAYKWLLDVRISVAVMAFIGQIISVDATFSLPIFEKMVQNFLQVPSAQFLQHQDISNALDQRSSFIHRSLRGIVVLSPASVHQLHATIHRFFPHKRFALEIQSQYVREILKICQYCPNLQGSTLDLILSKCVEIDVEIAVEEGGDVRVEAGGDDFNLTLADGSIYGADASGIFDFESEEALGIAGLQSGGGGARAVNNNSIKRGINSNNNNSNINSNSSASQQRIPDEITEMSEKLDAMTALVADYIEAVLAQDNKRLSDQLAAQLIQVFEERIITTHKSKFVQFIIFFICERCPDAAIRFGDRLFQLFFDESVSMIKRQSAVMYLASYLSRAKFLSTTYVNDQLTDLITWCGSYVELAEQMAAAAATANSNASLGFRSISGPHGGGINGTGGLLRRSVSMPELGGLNSNSNSSNFNNNNSNSNFKSSGNLGYTKRLEDSEKNTSHELFYCAFEAACYTLCFLGAEMAADHRDSDLIRTDWNRTASHASQPLRFCLQSVRIEFLKLALHVGLLTDEFWSGLPGDILEDDPNRVGKSQGDNSLSSGLNPLDSFFPFDPCLLRRLQTRIENGFRVWAGSVTLSDNYQAYAAPSDADLLLDADEAAMPSSLSGSSVSSLNPNPNLASSASSGGQSMSFQQISTIFSNQNPQLTLNQLRRANRSLSIGSQGSDYYSDIDGSAPSPHVVNGAAAGGGGGGGYTYQPSQYGMNHVPSLVARASSASQSSDAGSSSDGMNVSSSPLASNAISSAGSPSMHALTGSNLSAFLNSLGGDVGRMGQGGQDPDGANEGNGRRPRQYSISSTGSW